jgi:prepilin-type N-terminal cleavage/methylation domain-containing protein
MKQHGFTLIEALIVAAIVGILIWLPVGAYLTCSAKGKAMGLRTDWGPIQGCIIEHEPGQWVPLENFRAL